MIFEQRDKGQRAGSKRHALSMVTIVIVFHLVLITAYLQNLIEIRLPRPSPL
jgi:hypothetical protein